MKKIFLLLPAAFIIAFFTRSVAHATNYPFSATASTSAITAIMTNVTDTTSEFELYNGSNPVPPNDPASTTIKKAVGGSITWTITGTQFKNNTTYYLHVIKLSATQNGALDPSVGLSENVTATIPVVVGAGDKTSFYMWPTVSATGQTAIISGKIDTTKYPQVGNLKIELFLSLTDDFSNANHEGFAHDAPTGGSEGVAADGSYYWNVTGLTPSTIYSIKQVIQSGGVTIDTHMDKFNSSSGYTPVGSQKAQNEFNAQSYHLLAPWPGLSVLMDPGLCAQQKASGQLAPGAVCDINGFLNFVFKTLIGLTAVVLVLRLMFEGYQYMVTDVPFLKASAKSGFMSALYGLLLALSAYLILNTINPKLVSNTIAIANVDVGVDGDTNAPTTFVSNGKLPSGVQCPKSGKDSNVASIAQTWVGKVTYTYGGKDPSVQSDGTSHLDCSAYVNTVLNCSGYTSPTDYTNSGTSDIFSNSKAEKITSPVINNSVNGISLKPGDLVGWKQGDNGDKYGHVLIYIGNGQIMDSHGGNGHPVGKAIGTYPITQYASKITYIRRIPS